MHRQQEFVALNEVKDPHFATPDVQVLRCAQDDKGLVISLLNSAPICSSALPWDSLMHATVEVII